MASNSGSEGDRAGQRDSGKDYMTIASSSASFSHDEIRDRVRDLADRVLRPAAAEIDRSEAYPFSHARALRDLGIAGADIDRAEDSYRARDKERLRIQIEADDIRAARTLVAEQQPWGNDPR